MVLYPLRRILRRHGHGKSIIKLSSLFCLVFSYTSIKHRLLYCVQFFVKGLDYFATFTISLAHFFLHLIVVKAAALLSIADMRHNSFTKVVLLHHSLHHVTLRYCNIKASFGSIFYLAGGNA